jgi:hypothetical protein
MKGRIGKWLNHTFDFKQKMPVERDQQAFFYALVSHLLK